MGVSARLIDAVRSMSDAELIERLPRLSRRRLKLMHRLLAPEACDCPVKPIPCSCGYVYYGIARTWTVGDQAVGDLRGARHSRKPKEDVPPEVHGPCPVCHEEADAEPCRHFKRYYLSWEVLCVLEKLLDIAQPPTAPQRDATLSQAKRAIVLAKRHRRGYALWRDDDLVHDVQRRPCSTINMRLQRMGYTLAHWKKRGCPDDLDRIPQANGERVPGHMSYEFEKAREQKAIELRETARAALALEARRVAAAMMARRAA